MDKDEDTNPVSSRLADTDKAGNSENAEAKRDNKGQASVRSPVGRKGIVEQDLRSPARSESEEDKRVSTEISIQSTGNISETKFFPHC